MHKEILSTKTYNNKTTLTSLNDVKVVQKLNAQVDNLDDVNKTESNCGIKFHGKAIEFFNSIADYTKNMMIEGKTLQNLYNSDTVSVLNDRLRLNIKNKNMFINKTYSIFNPFDKDIHICINDKITGEFKRGIAIKTKLMEFTLDKREELKSIDCLFVGGWTTADSEYIKEKVMIFEGSLIDNDIPDYFTKIKSSGDNTEKIIIANNDNKIEILLPFTGGLKSLQNGIYDEINSEKNIIIKRVEKITLNGSENWEAFTQTSEQETGLIFKINFSTLGMPNNKNADCLSNNFPYDELCWTSGTNSIYCGSAAKDIRIRPTKEQVPGQNVAGLKAWLRENPLDVYYELETPIIFPLGQEINLNLIDGINNITSLNNIKPNINFSIKERESISRDFNNINLKRFRGTTLDINNSTDGITSDIVIEGNTLYNLIGKYNFSTTNYARVAYSHTPIKADIHMTCIIKNLSSSTYKGYLNEEIFKGETKSFTLNQNETAIIKAVSKSENELSKLSNIHRKTIIKNHANNNDCNIQVMLLKGDINYSGDYFESFNSSGKKENKIILFSEGEYKTDKLDVELPFDGGLKRINNTADIIEENKIIKKVDEIILDGTERWVLYPSIDNTVKATLYNPINSKKSSDILCDRFNQTNNFNIVSKNEEFCLINRDREIMLSVSSSNLDAEGLDGLLRWLHRNPITIQYILSEPEIFFINDVVLPNGITNIIDKTNLLINKKIGVIELNGSENWVGKLETDEYIRITLLLPNAIGGWHMPTCITNRDIKYDHLSSYYVTDKSIAIDEKGLFYLSLKKSELETPDQNGFIKWLNRNPLKVYYELKEYEEIDLKDKNSIKTFDGITEVYSLDTLSHKFGFNTFIKDKNNFTSFSGDKKITIPNSIDSYIKDLYVQGNSMVNIIDYSKIHNTHGYTYENNILTNSYTDDNREWGTIKSCSKKINKNKKYTLFVENLSYFEIMLEIKINNTDSYTHTICVDSNRFKIFRFESDENPNGLYLKLSSKNKSETDSKARIMIFDGCMDNMPIDYFNGLKSLGEDMNSITIKSVGKNLFNANKYELISHASAVINEYENGTINWNTGNRNGAVYFNIPMKDIDVTKDLVFSINIDSPVKDNGIGLYIREAGFKKIFGSSNIIEDDGLIKCTIPANTINTDFMFLIYRANIEGGNINSIVSNLQISVGTDYTEFNEYKESVTSINLPFTGGLKKLPNGVCDEFINGKIIKRVGEILLDGSQEFITDRNQYNEEYLVYGTEAVKPFVVKDAEGTVSSLCDKFYWGVKYNISHYEEAHYISNTGNIWFRIKRSELESENIDAFKKWITKNPVKVLYQLADPITINIEDGLFI